MISGSSAVHSDMIMWHRDEAPEQAALQLLSVIFGVPQISIRLAEAPETHRTLIRTFLDFWRKNRSILLDGELKAEAPDGCYSLVSSEKDGYRIAVRHMNVPFTLEKGMKAALFNATSDDRVVIFAAEGESLDGRSYQVFDCLGAPLADGTLSGPVAVISAPMSARIEIN
jgi:alpha-galactosidase